MADQPGLAQAAFQLFHLVVLEIVHGYAEILVHDGVFL
jgi:hypothetical protein